MNEAPEIDFFAESENAVVGKDRISQAIAEAMQPTPVAVLDPTVGVVEEFPVSTSVVESLGRIEAHRDRLVAGEGKIAPGQPIRMSDGLSMGDAVAQGDLNLVVSEKPPEGYKLRESGNGQLVPGNTTGAKHIVEDVTAVEIYDPPGWGPNYDNLAGPFIVAKREVTIGHPTHGAVTIPAGFCVECLYQRVWDQEQKKERRQRD